MTSIPGTIELSFEHADASGDFVETIVSVEFCFYPGDPGRYYGEPGDCYPAEPCSWEYQNASVDGKALKPGEWLEQWAIAKLDACEACDIEDCVPSGPDPDDLRDAAMDRAMERGSWT